MRELLPTHPTNVYYSRSMGEVTWIAVHHSGPAPLDMTAEETAIATANYHINTHGWPGCAYHAIIVPSGDWAYCQSLTVVSYHVGPYNRVAVGIALWGDYRTMPVPAVMVDALEEFCRWIMREKQNWAEQTGNVYQRPEIVGHRQLMATTCPGDVGMQAVTEMNRRLQWKD